MSKDNQSDLMKDCALQFNQSELAIYRQEVVDEFRKNKDLNYTDEFKMNYEDEISDLKNKNRQLIQDIEIERHNNIILYELLQEKNNCISELNNVKIPELHNKIINLESKNIFYHKENEEINFLLQMITDQYENLSNECKNQTCDLEKQISELKQLNQQLQVVITNQLTLIYSNIKEMSATELDRIQLEECYNMKIIELCCAKDKEKLNTDSQISRLEYQCQKLERELAFQKDLNQKDTILNENINDNLRSKQDRNSCNDKSVNMNQTNEISSIDSYNNFFHAIPNNGYGKSNFNDRKELIKFWFNGHRKLLELTNQVDQLKEEIQQYKLKENKNQSLNQNKENLIHSVVTLSKEVSMGKEKLLLARTKIIGLEQTCNYLMKELKQALVMSGSQIDQFEVLIRNIKQYESKLALENKNIAYDMNEIKKNMETLSSFKNEIDRLKRINEQLDQDIQIKRETMDKLNKNNLMLGITQSIQIKDSDYFISLEDLKAVITKTYSELNPNINLEVEKLTLLSKAKSLEDEKQSYSLKFEQLEQQLKSRINKFEELIKENELKEQQRSQYCIDNMNQVADQQFMVQKVKNSLQVATDNVNRFIQGSVHFILLLSLLAKTQDNLLGGILNKNTKQLENKINFITNKLNKMENTVNTDLMKEIIDLIGDYKKSIEIYQSMDNYTLNSNVEKVIKYLYSNLTKKTIVMNKLNWMLESQKDINQYEAYKHNLIQNMLIGKLKESQLWASNLEIQLQDIQSKHTLSNELNNNWCYYVHQVLSDNVQHKEPISSPEVNTQIQATSGYIKEVYNYFTSDLTKELQDEIKPHE